MIRDDIRAGIPAGILAATATAGALIAIGNRAATAARPFNIVAGHLLGQRADTLGFVPTITIVGILLHVTLCVVAGIAVAVVVRRGLAPAWVAAAGVALLSALVSIGIARRGGPSLAAVLALGDLLIFYVVMAVTLAVGIRFAFFDPSTSRVNHVDDM